MNCFKKYDVRGVVDKELTEDICNQIGIALATVAHAQTAVVGCDARASSPRLKKALVDGLLASGVDVLDLGQTGTEEIYFACQHMNCDLGVEVTASHNPIEFNGIKFVGRNSKPFSEKEFEQVKQHTIAGQPPPGTNVGNYRTYDHMDAYIDCLLSHIETQNIRPLRLVVNPGNGVAGRVIDAIEQRFLQHQVPITFIKIFFEPDSEFPNGIPNPLLPEDRWKTSEAVKNNDADLGIAWDGDFDRCFLFDENGEFIDGYYIVGLLAQSFLTDNPGQKVVHDPRVFWNTAHIVEQCDGEVVKSQTGHALIKAKMRSCDAIYGGEMSAHHYFKSFAYCDSGMIPWLLVVKLLSEGNQSISEIVSAMQAQFPSSGELNFRVNNSADTLERIQRYYEKSAQEVDFFDGLSMQFELWRFNLRSSATEPLLRLNIETRGDINLLQSKTKELTSLIASS